VQKTLTADADLAYIYLLLAGVLGVMEKSYCCFIFAHLLILMLAEQANNALIIVVGLVSHRLSSVEYALILIYNLTSLRV